MEAILQFLSQLGQLLSYISIFDIALALFGLFLISSLINWMTIKGPMHWPVMGIIPTLFFNLRRGVYEWVTEALIQSGGTFRYWGLWLTNAHGLATINPANVEYMLKTNFLNFPKGEYYRERFTDLLGGGIFNADGEAWKVQRQEAAIWMHSAGFVEHSAATVQNLVHHRLLTLLHGFSISGKTIDLQDILLRFTFDNICTVAFGVDTGCLAEGLPKVPFVAAFEQATEFTLFRFMISPFVWKAMRFARVGSEKRLQEVMQVVHSFAENCVRDRKIEHRKLGKLKDRSDLLSQLIDQEEGINHHFSDQFLRDLCISFILAGRDTSSVALTWFFWLIHNHPDVENRILDEIGDTIRLRKKNSSSNNPLSDHSDIIFTVAELKSMEYLHATLTEALRLYPSVPIDFKQALEDDVLPDGSVVKRGDRVMYSIYSMGRTEWIWGKDCRDFKPERWLKNGKFVSENHFKYVIFNGGPRLCAGKKFAYMQMKMVAASILLRYCVTVVEGQVIAPKITTTLYMKNGLQVIIKPRPINL